MGHTHDCFGPSKWIQFDQFMRRLLLSLALALWVLTWLWGTSHWHWTPWVRAIAYFSYFTVAIWILDFGYRKIRPKTDWSIRSGLLLVMVMASLLIAGGHALLTQGFNLSLERTINYDWTALKKQNPWLWSLSTGLLHAMIIGLMGMTVLIWRRPISD